jgi:hypothetical protein
MPSQPLHKWRLAVAGGVLGGALSALLAPRLGGRPRGPLAIAERRALARFAGTPCSRETRAGPPADEPESRAHPTGGS